MAIAWLRGAVRAALSIASLLALATAAAAQHALTDPIPPGARGDVRTISGDVRDIVGLAAAVAGRIDPVATALKELGARTTDTEIRIEMSADVLFDFDKADLKRAAEPSLDKVVTVLRSLPTSSVTVEGHTDGKGTTAYNEQLSRRRAAAVVSWLEARTTDRKTTLTVRALGASRPVAPNTKPDGSDDPDGRQRNRRVEIVVQK
jgi:outer membrane protein OmpA-like peptidoglycan-associated protein